MTAACTAYRQEEFDDDGRHLLLASNWELPSRPVLRNIFRRLPPNPDFAGAAFVSKPWLALPCDGDAIMAPQRLMPGLLLSEDRAVDPNARAILSFADGRIHDVAFLHAGRGARCVGSMRGWVVMVKRGAHGAASTDTVHIVHPLLPGQEFRLPDELSLFEAQVSAPEEAGFLAQPISPEEAYWPGHPIETTAEMLQRVYKGQEAVDGRPYISEIALSCSPASGGSDCVALCVYRSRRCLAVARPGDASWARVDVGWEYLQPCERERMVLSVAYHRASFYAVCYDGTVLRVSVPPPHAGAPRPRVEKFTDKPERGIMGWWRPKWWLAGDEAGGGLVFVGVERGWISDEPRFLHLYRWDEALGFWRRPKTLRGRALFLGRCGAAFFADARTLTWITGDCIYFTNDFDLRGGEDVMVQCYEMRSGRIYAVAKAGPKTDMAPPVWVMPFHE